MVTKLFVPERRIVVPKPPSYLKLDMAFAIGAGTQLMDKSRYRAHGTISGAAWADGAHGRCLDFNPATPSYVEIPASYTQLDFTSEDFSIIMRIRFDVLNTVMRPLVRGDPTADGWWVFRAADKTIQLYTAQSGAQQATLSSSAIISTTAWYTIGFSRSGTSVKVYVDGADDTVTPGTHINPATCARSLKVGIKDDKALNPFDGKVEFLRIFGGISLPASAHLAWHNALK